MKFEQCKKSDQQDILNKDISNDNSIKKTNLYNLLGWTIDPNTPYSNDEFIKFSTKS